MHMRNPGHDIESASIPVEVHLEDPEGLTGSSQCDWKLMGVEGDNAPTRQNIKSHLQKYRLLLKKRAAQAANDLGSGSGAGTSTMKMRSATKREPA